MNSLHIIAFLNNVLTLLRILTLYGFRFKITYQSIFGLDSPKLRMFILTHFACVFSTQHPFQLTHDVRREPNKNSFYK